MTEVTSAAVVPPPTVNIDLFSDENLANPYPVYQQMRELGPIVWLARHNAFFITKADLGREVLINWQDFSSSDGIGIFGNHGSNARVPSLILESDPPDHTVHRGILARLFTPKAMEGLRAQFQLVARDLVAQCVQKRNFDAHQDLAKPFTVNVICDAVGIPKDNIDLLLAFQEFTANVVASYREEDPRVARSRKILESAGGFAWIEKMRQRENLLAGGLGARLFALADDGVCSLEQASVFMMVFLGAAIESTMYTLTNGIKNFVDNPDQWALLRAQPKLTRAAFEEIVRFNVAPQALYRRVTRNRLLSGAELIAGQRIGVGMACANRDPDKYENPDIFDIGRKSVGNLGFGVGIHSCLGQMVARMEAEVLFTELATCVEKMRWTNAPTKKFTNAVSSWSRLPVEVGVA